MWNLWNFRCYILGLPYVASVEGSEPQRAPAPVCLFLVSASIFALEQYHKLRSRTSYNRYTWRKASHVSKRQPADGVDVWKLQSYRCISNMFYCTWKVTTFNVGKNTITEGHCLHSPLSVSEWITEWPTEWMCELRCRSSHQHIHIFTRSRKAKSFRLRASG